VNRAAAPSVRYPLIFLYELGNQQTGTPDIDNPPGDQSFAYNELCLETLDFADLSLQRRRTNNQYCSVINFRQQNSNSRRDDTFRGAIPLDTNVYPSGTFPELTLRPETAGPGKFHQPSESGLDCEVYNPEYFTFCQWVRKTPRPCFKAIYGLVCLDTAEKTYHQPVAFWTDQMATRIADVPGAVGARSCVFGFAPVFTNPDQFKQVMNIVMFDEWKLPRKPTTVVSE